MTRRLKRPEDRMSVGELSGEEEAILAVFVNRSLEFVEPEQESPAESGICNLGSQLPEVSDDLVCRCHPRTVSASVSRPLSPQGVTA